MEEYNYGFRIKVDDEVRSDLAKVLNQGGFNKAKNDNCFLGIYSLDLEFPEEKVKIHSTVYLPRKEFEKYVFQIPSVRVENGEDLGHEFDKSIARALHKKLEEDYH